MTPRLQPRSLILLLAAATLYAQTPTPSVSTANDVAFDVPKNKPKAHPAKPAAPLFNLDTIVLDPAHGGSDNGATISDNALEKDVNLAFANRLKGMLADRGFNVVMTRTSDTVAPKPQPATDANPPAASPTPAAISNDQRVETANRSHAVACLLIHASNGGHGVHIFSSSLPPSNDVQSDSDQDAPIKPWDTAQTAAIPNSLRLATDLATSLNNIRIPLVAGHASVRPIDSMTCPAVAIELAPLATEDGETPASDSGYQQRVAEAVASALVSWRGHAQSLLAAQAAKSPQTPAPPAAPVHKPKPKLVTPPVEVPDEPGPATHVPAPIVRKPPPDVPPPPPPPGGRP